VDRPRDQADLDFCSGFSVKRWRKCDRKRVSTVKRGNTLLVAPVSEVKLIEGGKVHTCKSGIFTTLSEEETPIVEPGEYS